MSTRNIEEGEERSYVEPGQRGNQRSDVNWVGECLKSAKVHRGSGRRNDKRTNPLEIKDRTRVRRGNGSGALRLRTPPRAKMFVLRVFDRDEFLIRAPELIEGD